MASLRNFSNAELGFADLTRAKLSSINLIRANLAHAERSNTDLIGADLTKPILIMLT